MCFGSKTSGYEETRLVIASIAGGGAIRLSELIGSPTKIKFRPFIRKILSMFLPLVGLKSVEMQSGTETSQVERVAKRVADQAEGGDGWVACGLPFSAGI